MKQVKEKGECKLCSSEISPNSSVFCEKHLVKNRERGRIDRERRKKAGLCRSCNEPICKKSTTWCEMHHEKQNALSRQLAQKIRETEMCESCNIQPRLIRKKLCEDCQQIANVAKTFYCRRVDCNEPVDEHLKHFCRLHGDEENDKLRTRRLQLKADNKCIFCFNPIGEQDATIPHILCADCRMKQKTQRKAVATA